MASIPSIETNENLAPEHREAHDASGYYSMIPCTLNGFELSSSLNLEAFSIGKAAKHKKGEPPHGQPAFLSNLNEF